MVPSQTIYENMFAWTGEHQGHTCDTFNSYVSVAADATQTVFVAIHLYQTNLPNQQFHVYVKLDGSAPMSTLSSFTTDANGTGDFAFSFKGLAPGSHMVIIEVNHVADNLTYYMDNGAANGGGGILFNVPD